MDFGQDRTDAFAVCAYDGDAILIADMADKFGECTADIFDAAIMIQMVILDIRHHRHIRGKFQERAVAFVRFRDDILALSETGISSNIAGCRPENDRRVFACFIEDLSHHGRCRGFPMCACDSDAFAPVEHSRQHVGAMEYGNAKMSRFQKLWIFFGDRRRNDNAVCALHMRRFMPDIDLCAFFSEIAQKGRVCHIGTGNALPLIEQNDGQRTHAHTADPYKME